jgi:predicted PurR-regulated permease PerM
MADQHNHVHVEVTTGTIIKFVLVLLFCFFIYILQDVVMVLLFALIIASAISPFANWLDQKGFPRLLGVLMLYLAMFGLVAFIFSMVIPVVSADISQLTAQLPPIVERISSSLDDVREGSPQYLDFLNEIQNMFEGVGSYLQQATQSIIGLIISIFGGFFSFIAVIVISFYLSVMKKGIESFIQAVAPSDYEAYIADLWKRAEVKVGRWLQGQLLLALIVGLTVYIGLSLMGIKYALILGLIAMVLEIVPVVGPVIAAIPAIFLAFIDSPTLGLWVLVFYVMVQQLENHILVPIVLGKTTGLNPVVVLIALLVGTSLAGIPGMILSVPIATIIVEMIDDLAKHKELAKKS